MHYEVKKVRARRIACLEVPLSIWYVGIAGADIPLW